MLTTTELETLAVMLDSATRHMTRARDLHGKYVWDGAADSTAPNNLGKAVTDMFEGFYFVQRDQDRLVTI